MLKLPLREREGKKERGVFSYYRNLFHSVHDSREQSQELKKQVEALGAIDKNDQGTIKLKDADLALGRKLILNKINLEIKPGKIFGIIGVSGSGKTTLLRTMVGFYTPQHGEVFFKDKLIQKQRNYVNGLFGFSTQSNSFYDSLNVDENLRFFGKLYGLNNDYLNGQIEKLLVLVDLYEHRRILAGHLSGGMRRRLDFACALIHDPAVLILDEPTEDLDPHLRNEILTLIREINKRGTTVIFTTHLLKEVEYLCDEVAIINQGKILVVGSPDELKKAYRGGYEVHLSVQGNDYSKYVHKLKGMKGRLLKNKLIVYAQDKRKAINILKKLLNLVEAHNDDIVFADIMRPSLSEVFHILTKNVSKKRGKNG